MNRKAFFDEIRSSLFSGKLNQGQVNGMNAILDHWEASGLTDIRWLAYMLATAYHETGMTMQPIKEKGSNAYFIKRYWTNKKVRDDLGNLSPQDAVNFCGKGLPQLTGRYNYTKMGKILGIDLVNNPDLMYKMDVAVKVMFEGMTTGKSFRGDFTGKHLGNYFNKTVNDPINARRIVNWLDKAQLIAGYHNKFLIATMKYQCKP